MKDFGATQCADCRRTIQKRAPRHFLCAECKKARHRKRNAEEWRSKPEVRERHRAYKAAWRAANPEMAAAKSRWQKYGITKEEFDALLADQGGRCSICDAVEPGGRGRSVSWHLDHDHSKDLRDGAGWRGVLCHSCNTGLGSFRDRIELLERAAAYLWNHRHGIVVVRCG